MANLLGSPATIAWLIAASALGATVSHAADRSKAVRAEFQRSNPCPSTGATRGACPGYQADHRVALCAGGQGADRAGNLQWLTVADHKLKTKRDVMECRRLGQ